MGAFPPRRANGPCVGVTSAFAGSAAVQTAPAVFANSSAFVQGLGEIPLDTPSAKGRRSQTSGVGHSRSSSTSRDALNTTDR